VKVHNQKVAEQPNLMYDTVICPRVLAQGVTSCPLVLPSGPRARLAPTIQRRHEERILFLCDRWQTSAETCTSYLL